MKVALITDTHFGVRNDSLVFANYLSRFYGEVFFPYLSQHSIKHLIHLGDIMDRRKYVNYVTARRFYEDFISPILKHKIESHLIIGNHDTYFKTTNQYNSMKVLYPQNDSLIRCYSDPTEIEIGGCSILLVPWICQDNFERSLTMINQTKAQILFGHLELKGFEMYKGFPILEGMDTYFLDKFDVVASGHFHHKSSKGNINYLGAPYEMTWSDYDDPRGFHIFDTETRSLEYVENPIKMFYKISYNDSDAEIDLLADDFSAFTGKMIKVVIKNKSDPFLFDSYMNKLERAEPADIQVVEDYLNLNLEVGDDIADGVEDTLSLLKAYVNQVAKNDDGKLFDLFRELYAEALAIE